MTILSTWPTNEYGTTWRHAVMYYDWQDDPIVSEAIDTIDPLKITVRSRSVAAIGFDSIAEMMIFRFADILPYGDHWDQERMCIVVDPCSDPEVLRASIEEKMDTVRFSVFGVAALDLADEAIYRQLSAALGERRHGFLGEMPFIDL